MMLEVIKDFFVPKKTEKDYKIDEVLTRNKLKTNELREKLAESVDKAFQKTNSNPPRSTKTVVDLFNSF